MHRLQSDYTKIKSCFRNRVTILRSEPNFESVGGPKINKFQPTKKKLILIPNILGNPENEWTCLKSKIEPAHPTRYENI